MQWYPRMVVYTLKQADDGEWSIRRMGSAPSLLP
jgi:hypothetical protein